VLFSPGWRAPVRQGTVLAVFTLGLLLGGTLSGTVVWLLSGLSAPIPPGGRGWAIREAGLIHIPLPQNARQIPQDVLQRRLRLGTLQFGFELGTGVRTFVSASAPYVLAIGLLLSHQAFLATAVVGTTFGLGRALTAALTLWARDPDRDLTIATRMPWITNLTAVVALIALVLLLLV
jgi:F0F1-type ATP synthase membrane subunit c/vacuolar-type H+-ATPase subunit K